MHHVHFGPENERCVPEPAACGLKSLTYGLESAVAGRKHMDAELEDS
jgi:hypothetical protein